MKRLLTLLLLVFMVQTLSVFPAFCEDAQNSVTISSEDFQKLLKRIEDLEKEVKKLKEEQRKQTQQSTAQTSTSETPVDETTALVEPPREFLGLFGTKSENVPSLDLSGFITVEFHYTNLEKDGRFLFEGIEIDPRFNLFEELQVGADIEFSEPYGEEDDLYVEQAYISWAPYTDRNLEITMGRFNSIIGIEDIDPDGALMATSSIFQNSLLPGDLTGVMIAYQYNTIRLFGAATNSYGYNDARNRISNDNNDDNTWFGRFEWRPKDTTVIGFNLVAGPEKDSNNHDYRITLDWDFQIQSPEFFYIGGEVLYGCEEDDENPDPYWFGAVGLVNFTFSKTLDATVRLEYIDDHKGGTRLSPNSGSLKGYRVWSSAIALRFHPLTNMDITLEYRFDGGDEAYFAPEDNSKTFTVEVSINF